MASNTIPNDAEPTTPLIIDSLPNIIKLTSTNYLSWKLQIEATLIGYNLFKYIDGSLSSPSPTITTDSKTSPNPAYLTWMRQDRLLYGTLIGTLEQSIVPLISLTTTSKELWDTLASTFASASRGHIKQLKAQFRSISKGPQSITDFMRSIKSCADQLALLGDPIKPEDITDKVLESLDSSYQGIIEAVNVRDTPISFPELMEKLIQRELVIKNQPIISSLPVIAHATSSRPIHTQQNYTTNNGHPHRTYQHTPKPYTRNSLPNQAGPKPFLGRCQWCHTKGHSLQKCHVFLEKHPSVRPPPTPHYSSTQPQAHAAQFSATNNSTQWLLDSGASHHVTQDLSNLSLHHPYDGTEEIVIGDGSGLPITHSGFTSLSTPSKSLSLSNVLCVPTMKKNLISISQLCSDNNLLIEFSCDSFVVKDRLTGARLLTGPTKNGVYELPSSSSIIAFPSFKASAIDWHHRLGHPASPILKFLVSSFNLNVSSDFSFNCDACQCNKSHKLPFNQNSLRSQSPLELIYTDLWTSPVYSFDGYKYYVIFVDHFTKYIWFYPLKKKSDTKDVFIRFKALVEKFFEKPIKSIYSDNGGEYEALRNFLTIHGVSHLTTPPHTPEHNGYAERRHRHIVETGLSLLSHAQLPLCPTSLGVLVFIIFYCHLSHKSDACILTFSQVPVLLLV